MGPVVAGESAVYAAPRSHAKSTLFSFLYPLWSAVYRRKRFVVLLSSSGTQAELFADAIKKEIEQNELLAEDFGPLCGEEYGLQWRGHDLLIAHPRRGPDGEVLTDRLGHPIAKDTVRLVARGAGASIRGLKSRWSRPDCVIADDLEVDEHVATLEQRIKLRSWWYRAVEPMMDPGVGQSIVIGTILHHDSLLAHLIGREDGGYRTALYRALDGDVPLWPERWSRESLELMRSKIGSLAFAQEYLNQPMDTATQVFRPAWWRWYTSEEVEYDEKRDVWSYLGQDLDIYAACDPALAGQDEFVTLVIGVTRDNHVLVLDFFGGHLDFPPQVQHIKKLSEDWLPRVIGVEANAYQAALGQHVRREILVPIRQVSHTRDGGSGGRAKPRIVAMAPYVEGGQILLRAATETEPGTMAPEIGIKVHAKHWPLYEQATEYPMSSHDDRLDCLELALHVARVRRFFEGFGRAEEGDAS